LKRVQMKEYAADFKAKHGKTIRQTRPNPRRFATHCARCDEPVRWARSERAICRECYPAESRAKARRRAAARKLAKAAEGSASSWPWCQGVCATCGDYYVRHGASAGYCSKACNPRQVVGQYKGSKSWISRRRRLSIYERDEWRCQLCHAEVIPDLPPLDDWSATLDHIIPRSWGGTHESENLRLAHRWCNLVRGDESRAGVMEVFA
jgi:hypothetical protein